MRLSRHYYILGADGEPKLVNTLEEWAELFTDESRRVARDKVGESEISTVFLCLDHGHGDGPPVLWETMVFGGKLDGEQNRCSGSREQAQAMHAAMVERVKAAEITPET
jgi:hypothetical protein